MSERSVYLSGAEAPKKKEARFKKLWKKATRFATGAAIVTIGMTGCGPSNKEIKEMVAAVPDSTKNKLALTYDKELLQNINRFENHMETAAAIDKAHSVTRDEATDDMPSRSERDGADFYIEQHADKRLEESRTADMTATLTPVFISSGNATTAVIRSTTYEYHPEFKDQLKKEIAAQEKLPLMPTRDMGR